MQTKYVPNKLYVVEQYKHPGEYYSYKAGHCLTNGKIYIRIIEVDEVNDVYVVEQYKHPGEYYSSIDAIDKSWKLSGCWIEGR